MQFIISRFKFLFRSTKGLVLVSIALIALVTAFMGTLSGPMREWGVTSFVTETFGLRLLSAEREGRIILLYHTIAIAVVALETYLITESVPMKPHEQTQINATITFGYIITLIFGLKFGYFGHGFAFHGLYIFGLSLVFFAGLLLAAALWPWRAEFRVTDPQRAHWGTVDLERAAFFAMAVATLGSALFGAVTGSYWGNGHETFLAEDILREPEKTALQLAIIGHLHIMLTLIAVALALLVGRRFDFKGTLHKISMPLFIVGTIVITLGVWAVVPFESIAHIIIYVGSTIVLLGALFMVIYSFGKITRDRLAEQGIKTPTFGQKVAALLHDPLKFGMLWQMVFMNFVVSFPGIFMAVTLEKIFRVWPLRQERVLLTGHWHVLAGIVATIILLYYADLVGLTGRVRKVFGWVIILASDLAFGAALIYMLQGLFVSTWDSAPLANVTTLLMDAGLGLVLIALAALMSWRLIDLFKDHGRWRTELSEAEAEVLP
ncbi:MAG: hypothetical protein DRN33_02565 [Thermoplasmata archaeon]|nr:MAG: hypothetical protein DRN33_02565 [Thermoplasmata archaeon]